METQVLAAGSYGWKNKVMAILAYIIFFIPLLAAKESKFAMYHANQGLVLFLLAVAVSIVGTIIPLGWFLILPIGSISRIDTNHPGDCQCCQRRNEAAAGHRKISIIRYN